MRIKGIIIFLFVILFYLNSFAQNWQNLGINNIQTWAIRCFFADTVTNKLYIGEQNTSPLRTWDGSTVSVVGTGLGYPVRAVIRFQNNLYVSANAQIVRWNGVSYDTAGLNVSDVYSFFVDTNLLYVAGGFAHARGVAANGIAVWDGVNWSNVGNFPNYNSGGNVNIIYAITKYKGEIYIAGNFPDSTGNVSNIARWNGTQWKGVGGGFHGGMDEAYLFAIYNNELYVAGSFVQAHGNVGNYIQKWNGTNWSDVGGGVMGIAGGNGQIWDMKVINNKLYVVGDFSFAGGIPAQYIASWDGVNWCGYKSSFDNLIGAIEEYNNEIYIGGGFTIIDGDTTGTLAKWIGGNFVDTCGNTTGVGQMNVKNESLTIYPNPATTQISIEFNLTETKNSSIEIKNVLGQTVKTINNRVFSNGKNKIEIDVSEFSSGLYFVQLQSENKIMSEKFIKE